MELSKEHFRHLSLFNKKKTAADRNLRRVFSIN